MRQRSVVSTVVLLFVVLLFSCGYSLPDEDFDDLAANTLAVNDKSSLGITTQSISATNTAISITKPIVAVTASSALLMDGTPTVTNGSNGQIVRVVNAGTNKITLQDESVVTGSNLRLQRANIVLEQYGSVELLYVSGSGWYRISDSTTGFSMVSTGLIVNNITLSNATDYLFLGSSIDRTLTSTPTIALGKLGQAITIFNMSSHTLTLQDESVLTGSKLRFQGAANRALPPNTSVRMVYDGAEWYEMEPAKAYVSASTLSAPDSSLSANVPLKDGANVFSNTNTFQRETTITTAAASDESLKLIQGDNTAPVLKLTASIDGGDPFNSTVTAMQGDGDVTGPRLGDESPGWTFVGMVRLDVNDTTFFVPYFEYHEP